MGFKTSRRLHNIGLGDLCLELHSHRANKKNVLEDLNATLNLNRPKQNDVARAARELRDRRVIANRHAESMHRLHEPFEFTAYQVLGKLVRLRAQGTQPARFNLDGSQKWSREAFDQHRNMIDDLATHLAKVGDPTFQPWIGVSAFPILPTDVDRHAYDIANLRDLVQKLLRRDTKLSKILSCTENSRLPQVVRTARLGEQLSKVPEFNRAIFANPVWKTNRKEISQLVTTGRRLTELKGELRDVFSALEWKTDFRLARRDFAHWHGSFFRFFAPPFYRARSKIAAISGNQFSADPKTAITQLDLLIEGQKASADFERLSACDLGRSAFGENWRGLDSNWSLLVSIDQWDTDCSNAKLPDNFREITASISDMSPIRQLVREIAFLIKKVVGAFEKLASALQFDYPTIMRSKTVKEICLRVLEERLQKWSDHIESLTTWAEFQHRVKRIEAAGMTELARHIMLGQAGAESISNSFQYAYFENLIRDIYRQAPELSSFSGDSHEAVLARFRELDLDRQKIARILVASKHFSGVPQGEAHLGEMKILAHEIKKKRRHKSIRSLLSEAGSAVQAIKPVFMMSPISVSQFLAPGSVEFDLLIIDEASQVQPVDAYGAIARCKQIVVVGDDRQLPPTPFFAKLIGDEEPDEDDAEQSASDLESILGLCETKRVANRMLQWHYRSRHESLIAVSNAEFYQNRLKVVPSPFKRSPELGLEFVYLANGVFDRGKTATNQVEARAVAEAAIEHARKNPHMSLGIGAFSVSQRDSILAELELLRRQSPDVERFFAVSGTEPFFVKNLENIQGDERDVIFISVGYAMDSTGIPSMNFGPLNKDGGERRLNVLISRAKEKCRVFSSIRADYIDLNKTNARGVRALKTYLQYAETGILDVARRGLTGYDSDFELSVAEALEKHGLEVHSQVGVAGFFIDLAVVDSSCPGRYLLGIECDGASYHSSRSARDRDRLRQKVLEDRYWIIHRIWSTDWFKHPDAQLRKTLAAIEDAKVAVRWHDGGKPEKTKPAEPESIPTTIDRSSEALSPPQLTAIPYRESQPQKGVHGVLQELPPHELAGVVVSVVVDEGPIHIEELHRRVAQFWGLSRVGSKIRASIDEAISYARSHRLLAAEDDFLATLEPKIQIRDRTNVSSTNLRKAEFLPPVEIRKALTAVIGCHIGITRHELFSEVAALIGLGSTGQQIKRVLTEQLEKLIVKNIVAESSDRLSVTNNS